MRRIYLDHSATTPVRAEVVEAMLPYMTEQFGNASSLHTFGREGHKALEEARETIASLIGASPDEIVFTSGGTESDNLAIMGTVTAARDGASHVITAAIEHHAVLSTCMAIEKHTVLPVDEDGLVDPAELTRVLDESPDRPAVVSIMAANNEVGTIQPIAELAAIAAQASTPFHTDAVQAVGKVPVDVDELGVDMLTATAHKFYGPKGTGILYVRKGTRLAPLQHGGHHEKSRRAGTENVPGAVGMARALELACEEMAEESARQHELRDMLQNGLMEAIDDSLLNGHQQKRLPHLLNISFENVEGESILLSLDAVGIAASTGSACTSGTLEPSHVLMAMGRPPEIAHGSLRFSLGRSTTTEDIEYVLEKLPPIIARLREMSPFAK